MTNPSAPNRRREMNLRYWWNGQLPYSDTHHRISMDITFNVVNSKITTMPFVKSEFKGWTIK